jgi:NAD(P)-dependent dehydrogenase (short-subunit alcohol dehydrogenase family)
MKELKGKVALITGVGRSKGIGAALCRKLSSEGINIFYTYWHSYDTQQFSTAKHPEIFMEELRANDVHVEGIEIDLSKPNSSHELFKIASGRCNLFSLIRRRSLDNGQGNPRRKVASWPRVIQASQAWHR